MTKITSFSINHFAEGVAAGAQQACVLVSEHNDENVGMRLHPTRGVVGK